MSDVLGKIRSFMEKEGIPGRDAYDLPTSTKAFPDGANFRIEIAGVERASTMQAMIDIIRDKRELMVAGHEPAHREVPTGIGRRTVEGAPLQQLAADLDPGEEWGGDPLSADSLAVALRNRVVPPSLQGAAMLIQRCLQSRPLTSAALLVVFQQHLQAGGGQFADPVVVGGAGVAHRAQFGHQHAVATIMAAAALETGRRQVYDREKRIMRAG